MAYDNRHTIQTRLSDDLWQMLSAIRDENGLETNVQAIRFLIRNYHNKDKHR